MDRVIARLKRIARGVQEDILLFFRIATPTKGAARDFLEQKVFSWLNAVGGPEKKLLFIGVASYTWHYYSRLDYDVCTIELNEERAKFGKKGAHVVGSATELPRFYAESSLDVIVANGLIGYGLNSEPDFDQLMVGCHHCLKPGGILVLGYNNDEKHLRYRIGETAHYGKFREITPEIEGVTSPTMVVHSLNHHTFTFLKAEK